MLVTCRSRRDVHRDGVVPQVSDLITRVRRDHKRHGTIGRNDHIAGQRPRGVLERDPAVVGRDHRDPVIGYGHVRADRRHGNIRAHRRYRNIRADRRLYGFDEADLQRVIALTGVVPIRYLLRFCVKGGLAAPGIVSGGKVRAAGLAGKVFHLAEPIRGEEEHAEVNDIRTPGLRNLQAVSHLVSHIATEQRKIQPLQIEERETIFLAIQTRQVRVHVQRRQLVPAAIQRTQVRVLVHVQRRQLVPAAIQLTQVRVLAQVQRRQRVPAAIQLPQRRFVA